MNLATEPVEYTRNYIQAESFSADFIIRVDSLKYLDGVISQEGWLESASARLDSELEEFEATNDASEKVRGLAQKPSGMPSARDFRLFGRFGLHGASTRAADDTPRPRG